MKKDLATVERIQLMHPKLRDELETIYEEILGRLTVSRCRFIYTLRTFAEQQALFDQGRTKPGKKVTNARPGLSYHNYGLAVDFVLLLDRDGDGNFTEAAWDTETDFDKDGMSDWMEVVQVFKEFGWEWGGDWKFVDPPHFQKTFGYNVRQLLALRNGKKVDKEGYVII